MVVRQGENRELQELALILGGALYSGSVLSWLARGNCTTLCCLVEWETKKNEESLECSLPWRIIGLCARWQPACCHSQIPMWETAIAVGWGFYQVHWNEWDLAVQYSQVIAVCLQNFGLLNHSSVHWEQLSFSPLRKFLMAFITSQTLQKYVDAGDWRLFFFPYTWFP